MKQINSKFNMYIKSVDVINYNIEKIIFNAIFCSFGMLAFFYIFLLGNMVKNILERQSLEVNVRVLTNEVRDLEANYFSMSNDIDLAFSHSMGFKETKTTFATRKTLGYRSGGSLESVKIPQNDL